MSPPSRLELTCPGCRGSFAVHALFSDTPDEPHHRGRCPLCGAVGTAPTGTEQNPATFAALRAPTHDGDLGLALSSTCRLCSTFLVDREPECRFCGEVPDERRALAAEPPRGPSEQAPQAEDPEAKAAAALADLEAKRAQGTVLRGRLAGEAAQHARRRDDYAGLAAEWDRRAVVAVRAGDDGLARDALLRNRDMQALADAHEGKRAAAAASLAEVESALATLERRIAEQTRKRDLARAGKARAKARASIDGALAAPPAVRARPLASARLDQEPAQLLGDRLRARLAEGAGQASRRVGGLMGMTISPRRERQIGLSIDTATGPSRVLIEVSDPFSLVGDSMPALGIRRLAELSSQIGVHFSLAPTGVGSRSLLLTASELSQNRADILVAEALVPHPDGTLLLVRFYTDKATAERDANDVVAYANRVSATLEAGPRLLERGPRDQAFGPPGQPQAFCLPLPAGFAWDTDQGPDFVVHGCWYVVPFGVEPLVVKLYLGHHPSRHYARPPQGAKPQAAQGQVLGREAVWQVIDDDERILQEVIARVSDGQQPLYLHAFGSATSPEQARYVRELVGGMRVMA